MEATLQLQEKLRQVQIALKVPKDLTNTFANFKYRNAEGILEKVKPLLAKEGVILTISDEMLEVGGRVYVKASAIVQYKDQKAKVDGWAREQESKKGMDEAQVTGAASSYARKYALAGLFLLDDGNDPDSHDNTDQGKTTTKTSGDERPASDKQKKFIGDLYEQKTGKDPKLVAEYIESEYSWNPKELTADQASHVIEDLQAS